ncbi:MAG: hypothetical protein RLO12_06710 [Fulvivirga sp.]
MLSILGILVVDLSLCEDNFEGAFIGEGTANCGASSTDAFSTLSDFFSGSGVADFCASLVSVVAGSVVLLSTADELSGCVKLFFLIRHQAMTRYLQQL